MKTTFAMLLLATLVAGAPVKAASSATAPSTPSPLLGTWAVDVSRLPMPPAARPKRVTIAFRDVGGGQWTTRVEIVDATGAKTSVETTHDLNGTAAHGQGTLTEADVVAARLPAPNVLVMALGKERLPASTRIYTVGNDNTSMTETVVYHWDDGIPSTRMNYFSRLP